MLKLTIAVVLLFASVETGFAQPGVACAFELHVQTPEGGIAREVGVKMIGLDGTRTADTDENGVARFCDALDGLYDFAIGLNLCGQVVVRYVAPILPETRKLTVRMVRSCHANLPRSRCTVIARYATRDHRILPGVRVRAVTANDERYLDSDAFGRVIQSVKYDDSLTLSVADKAYEAKAVTVQCSPENTIIEPDVIVTPR